MPQTPLYEEHVSRGGKIIQFHGWDLPLQFAGILPEHHHTRTKVSVFDCCHMGRFIVQGRDALARLDGLVYFNPFALPAGRCRYASILNECGGIVDDIIVMKLAEDELLVVTNCAPLVKVSQVLTTKVGAARICERTGKIDVQGPMSREVLRDLGLSAVDDLRYFQVRQTEWQGMPVVISRTGYTGELGYELYLPAERIVSIWRTLLSNEQVRPAGLGARDTLRTEMGYTLYGQDVDETKTTLEAGMGRFIDWECNFRGKESLWLQREMGRHKVRTGIRSMDRRAPRRGYEVRYNGEAVGRVTSGTFGPSVGYGIGMAYLPKELTAPGTWLTAGPRDLVVETAEFPFYRNGTCRMP